MLFIVDISFVVSVQKATPRSASFKLTLVNRRRLDLPKMARHVYDNHIVIVVRMDLAQLVHEILALRE